MGVEVTLTMTLTLMNQLNNQIYFYKINAGNYSETKKMILIKY
jgi:hypothetical protein